MSAIGGDAETPLAAKYRRCRIRPFCTPFLRPRGYLEHAVRARCAASRKLRDWPRTARICTPPVLPRSVPTPGGLQTNKVLAMTSHAAPGIRRCVFTHADGVESKSVLHFCPLAKYAIAFPRMSRSMVTRASSAAQAADLHLLRAGYLRPAVGPIPACLRVSLDPVEQRLLYQNPTFAMPPLYTWPDSTKPNRLLLLEIQSDVPALASPSSSSSPSLIVSLRRYVSRGARSMAIAMPPLTFNLH